MIDTSHVTPQTEHVTMATHIDLDAAIAAEAKRLGITVKELLQRKTPKMVAVHTRLPRPLLAEIDADAAKRGESRADVIRERCERGPVAPAMRRVVNAKG